MKFKNRFDFENPINNLILISISVIFFNPLHAQSVERPLHVFPGDLYQFGTMTGGKNVDINRTADAILLPPYWVSNTAGGIHTFYTPLGIGTASPTEQLDIWHNDTTGGISINQTGENQLYKSEIKFKLAGTQEWAVGSTTDTYNRKMFYIWSQVNQTTAFFIDGDNGMTGIGTEWPSAKLEVAGDFQAASAGIGINPPPSSSPYKLWVDGGIMARKVKVTIGTFADYVFDTDYSLMPLYDLKTFIALNKHLPDMPTAQEIEDNNGVEIGEMQTILLKKVEEQTLYILDLQKQIDELKAQMKQFVK